MSAEREASDLAWLTGQEAVAALAAAVGPDGAELLDATVHDVHHRPGAGVTVGYDVRLRGPSGEVVTEYLLVTTAELGSHGDPHANAGIVELQADDRTLHVWRHPGDPLLPGLAIACSVEEAARRVGFEPEEGEATLELIGYRPLRRAVLSLTNPMRRVYLKVVRPQQLEVLLARNRYAEPAGAPEVLDVWPESVLVFAQAQGEPLPELLARDGAAGVDPREFVRCLEALDPAGLDLPLRPAWTDRTLHYADAARNVLPDEVARIEALADGIVKGLATIPSGHLVVTHGDFHAANILMNGPRIGSLLDVDTLGPGQRVDDLACLVGHLAVLPSLAPGVYPAVPDTIRRWLEVFDEYVDPAALRLRAAGVVLSLLASMPAQAERDVGTTASLSAADGTPAGAEAVHLDAMARLAAAEDLVAEGLALR